METEIIPKRLSNNMKTSDKQMHMQFYDSSFFCEIYLDKFERQSDEHFHIRSIVKCCGQLLFTHILCLRVQIAKKNVSRGATNIAH